MMESVHSMGDCSTPRLIAQTPSGGVPKVPNVVLLGTSIDTQFDITWAAPGSSADFTLGYRFFFFRFFPPPIERFYRSIVGSNHDVLSFLGSDMNLLNILA